MRRMAWCGCLILLAGACGDDGTGADVADVVDDAADGLDGEPDGEPEADSNDVEADAGEDGDGADATPPLDPEPGEVVELTAGPDGAFAIDLATPAGPARQYGLVLHSGFWGSGQFDYELTVTAAAAATSGAAKTDSSASAAPPRPRFAWPVAPEQAARALREGAIRVARDPLPPPTVGDRRSFQISDAAGRPQTIEAECLAVGDDIAAWMDRTTAGGEDPAAGTLADVMTGFDEIVLPRHRIFFGEEPDTCGDGVINLLWSPLVADVGAMAYFSPCDMFDAAALPPGCGASNEQEILYATPPSMLPSYMASVSAILDLLAHESQHLIYFHRKVMLAGALGNENMYILEGWAELGEDLSGYGTSLFFIAQAGLENTDQVGAYEFLRAGGSYVESRDGLLRGVSYLWTRYLFDRMGGERAEADGTITDLGGVAWSRAIIDLGQEGIQAIELSCEEEIEELIFDWWTALFLTGRTDAGGEPLAVEPRFAYRSQYDDPLTGAPRGFDPYADFRGMFSLVGPVVVTPASADGRIPATGSELVLLEPDGTASRLSVRVTAEADAELRVRVVRLR
ncbi:MAG: hypothetical protein JXB32_10640 [Deltaproteobacteria bacterium]|nr:hypothetical protein [Deltaproteobacteria bacterium]